MPFGESSQDPNLPPHSQVVDVYLDWDKNPHVQPLKDIKNFFLGLQNSSILSTRKFCIYMVNSNQKMANTIESYHSKFLLESDDRHFAKQGLR